MFSVGQLFKGMAADCHKELVACRLQVSNWPFSHMILYSGGNRVDPVLNPHLHDQSLNGDNTVCDFP